MEYINDGDSNMTFVGTYKVLLDAFLAGTHIHALKNDSNPNHCQNFWGTRKNAWISTSLKSIEPVTFYITGTLNK